MKRRMLKLCAVVLAIYFVIASLLPLSAFAAQPSKYSQSSNSGTRHEVCTSLDGTSAGSYYTGNYTYEKLAAMSSSNLKTALNTLMSDTHKKSTSYSDCRDMATETDCENNDTSHFSTIYTSYDATYSEYSGGSGWNREHVWPQSLGGFGTSGAGADLHHIRPSENKTNSQRGNLKYGNVSGGSTVKGNLSGLVGGAKGTYYEPLDNVKGDVARIILYVHVRYYDEYTKCGNVTNVFQSVDVLLEWCALDPVDTWEMGRNEVVQGVQGNRNVFIDYPELAWTLFGKTAPANMTTPSGGQSVGGGNGNTGDDNTDTPVIPDTPVGPTVTPIATIHASSANEYTAEGVVVAKNAKSYLLKDDTGVILVYLNQAPSVEIGDKLRVTGNTSTYGGAIQFGQDTQHTKIGTETVQHPVVKVLDGAAVDACQNKLTLDYVKVVGKLTTSGSGTKIYYNLAIDGATLTGSVTYPDNTAALANYLNQDVEVFGYITGITGSSTKYLNLMMTDIRVHQAGVACTHGNTQLVGKLEADCETAGYTGDTYCADCGTKLATGTSVAPVGQHTWGAWQAVTGSDVESRTCSVCGKTETRAAGACDHLDTEIRDAKAATCEEEGYTGDTYCASCGELIASGSKIDAGHKFGASTVVKEPTGKENGTSKKVCETCGYREYETVPATGESGCSAVASSGLAMLALIALAGAALATKKQD